MRFPLAILAALVFYSADNSPLARFSDGSSGVLAYTKTCGGGAEHLPSHGST